MAEEQPVVAGVRLGVDVGTVRVGVAVCDREGLLAVPLTTLLRDEQGGEDFVAVAALAAAHEAEEVVVGLPLQLDGSEGLAAAAVRAWVTGLLDRAPDLRVRLLDERLTTAHAHKAMAAAGRDSRRRRELVDQAAAVAILTTFLDARRAGAGLPGTVVGRQTRRARKPRSRGKGTTDG